MSKSSAVSPIVIDASAVVELLLGGAGAARIEPIVVDVPLIAPDLVNPEVLQSLRRLQRSGRLSAARASTAVQRLADSSISRVPTTSLLREVWRLRDNLSAYDGCYVALAQALSCPLLTCDGALARSPDLGITLIRA